MPSISETLRHERLKRNLELDEVSHELKISPRFLEAIEGGNFDKLPGGVFAKSFARQYAKYLGLDEDEAAGEVQRTIASTSIVPQLDELAKMATADIHVPRVDSTESFGAGHFSVSSPLQAFALVVLAMFSCAGVYSWWTRHPAAAQQNFHAVAEKAPTSATVQPPVDAAPAPVPQAELPAVQAEPQPAQPPQTSTQPSQSGALPSSPLPGQNPASDAAAKPVVATRPSASRGPVRLEITAAEPVWVLAQTDGKYAFSGTLDANQTRMVEANSAVVLRLGNAGGVTITLNGKPLGEIGPKGQVRTVQFTSGGFQIVAAAPKPSAPFDPLDRL